MSYTNLILILKARQLGFTTLIQLVMLDACLVQQQRARGHNCAPA